MAEDVQGLLEKIHTDGIAKAQREKDDIIAAANKEAAGIVAAARKQADEFIVKAKENAAAAEAKAQAAIRQAARDAVIALKTDLLTKLNAVARVCAGEAMTPEVMTRIVLEMAKAWGAGADVSLEILLPKAERDRAESYLKSKLLAALKREPVINLTGEFNSGLQIAFRGDEVYFDFSDEALSEVLCRFVGAKLAAVIKG